MDPQSADGLSSLRLKSHAELLQRIITRAEREPAVRFIELGCSLARGAGDELSDLDIGFGLADEAWPDALSAVAPMLADVGDLVDLLEHRISDWGDIPHRRFFAQYRDGMQVDLVVLPASRRRGMPVGNIAIYDPDGRLADTVTSSLERATAENVREWAFLAWIALANVDKYLRRGASWEALEQLHQARGLLWRLWNVARGIPYPGFGLTSALDQSPPAIPPGLEHTVATLEHHDLRRASTALAALLESVSSGAGAQVEAALPTAMESFILERLTGNDE